LESIRENKKWIHESFDSSFDKTAFCKELAAILTKYGLDSRYERCDFDLAESILTVILKHKI
jgi:hypothetical protein